MNICVLTVDGKLVCEPVPPGDILVFRNPVEAIKKYFSDEYAALRRLTGKVTVKYLNQSVYGQESVVREIQREGDLIYARTYTLLINTIRLAKDLIGRTKIRVH